MNAADHYREAERLLANARLCIAQAPEAIREDVAASIIETARVTTETAAVHAQLAQVGATLLATYPGLDKARDALADAVTGDGR